MKTKLFRWKIALAVILPCLLISASAASAMAIEDVIYMVGDYHVDDTDAYGKKWAKYYAQGVDANGAEIKTLFVDMLNYGATAQSYFGGYRIVIVKELVVADGCRPVTCEVYNADTNQLVGSASDSMEGYVARNASKYPWLETIMNFSDSAYNYLH